MKAALSSWPTGEVWVLLLAIFGGLVVLWGLAMEFASEDEKRYEKIGIDGFRKLKAKGRRGEIVVMAGIILEVGIGAGLAVKADIDINAAKAAWRSQRIYAFEATARLLVRPLSGMKDFEQLPQVPFLPTIPFGFFNPNQKPEMEDRSIILFLGRSEDMANGAYSRENAQIQDDEAHKYLAFEMNGTNRFVRIDIHFGGRHENFFENRVGNTWEFSNDSLPPEDLDAIDLLLPFRCEIISGEINMEIDNGLTNIVFQIPKQTTFVCAATSVSTNGTFVPIDFSPKIRAEHEKENGAK